MPASIARQRLVQASKMFGLPFFRLACRTGLLTGIAAGTSSAGHLIAVRNADSVLDFHIARLWLAWWTTVGFTAAQELAFEVHKLSAYTVAHSAGTGAVVENLNARGDYTANTTVTARVAGTDALTAGTQTIGGRLMAIGTQELADAATVPKKRMEGELVSRDDKHPVDILKPNEGLLVRPLILMGAAGVGRLALVAEGWLKDSSPT